MNETAESNQSLWMLTAAPAIWAAHFLASYITAAVWCAKSTPHASLAPVRVAIAAYTVVALAGVWLVARWGHRRHGFGGAELPHDGDTPEDRHRFLGFATLLVASLAAIAILYEALVVLFFGTCA